VLFRSIWSLEHHPHLPYLASASADGSIGMWAADAESLARQAVEMRASFTVPSDDSPVVSSGALDVPTCLTWVPWESTQLLAGYASARVATFDVNRGKQVVDLRIPPSMSAVGSQAGVAAVTSACCHQVQQLAALGHADSCARLLDLSSGKIVCTLSDHDDAVTSVCFDPTQGNSLVTGSHDGCVRTFDLRMARCRQRLWVHRPKHDEAIHSVHHGHRLLVAGGADGSIVVLLPSD